MKKSIIFNNLFAFIYLVCVIFRLNEKYYAFYALLIGSPFLVASIILGVVKKYKASSIVMLIASIILQFTLSVVTECWTIDYTLTAITIAVLITELSIMAFSRKFMACIRNIFRKIPFFNIQNLFYLILIINVVVLIISLCTYNGLKYTISILPFSQIILCYFLVFDFPLDNKEMQNVK